MLYSPAPPADAADSLKRGMSMANRNPGRRLPGLVALCATLCAVFVLGSGAGIAQESEEGVFIDGEFVEYYEYVPDFMPPEELKSHIDRNSQDVVIVDTAAELIFEEEHIPGAVNFPWVHEITPPIALPRDKTLVLYCACNDHEDSADMAEKLTFAGYLDVKVLEGGWFKWLDLGYDIVTLEPEEVR
jgi:rhodanese-related sulfurtransferase